MMDLDVKAYLKVYKNIFSEHFCSQIIKQIELCNWNSHSYYSYTDDVSTSFEKDFLVSYDSFDLRKELDSNLWNVFHKYISQDMQPVNKWFSRWNGYTPARFNRYEKGTLMRPHCDHIQSIFDGQRKGIPTLTILGALNDNYSGGELIFWEHTPIELKTGDVMVFPSNFLYPHEVKEVKDGTRYSFVSWAW